LPALLPAEWLYWLRHLTPLVPAAALALDPEVQPAAAAALAAQTLDYASGAQLSPVQALAQWLAAVGAELPVISAASMGSTQEVQVEHWCLMWGRVHLGRVRLVAQTALAARLATQAQPGGRDNSTNSTHSANSTAAAGIPPLVYNMPGEHIAQWPSS
jgi:hypothetical protein